MGATGKEADGGPAHSVARELKETATRFESLGNLWAQQRGDNITAIGFANIASSTAELFRCQARAFEMLAKAIEDNERRYPQGDH